MADASTNILNKTVMLAINQSGIPDSISVRLTGVDAESTVEIDGISWGVQTGPAEVDIDDLDFGSLFVIRNEVFDASFTYNSPNVHAAAKDVVFQDSIIRQCKYRVRQFKRPIKLTGYANYLVIMPGPTRIANPGVNYTSVLTVQGRIKHKCHRPSRRY